jgi:ABC-type multidrug transport system fused ATPase/permease subunit
MENYFEKLTKEIYDVAGDNLWAMTQSSVLTLAKTASIVAYPIMLGKSLQEMEEDDDSSNFMKIAPWMLGYAGLWAVSELIPYIQENALHPVAMDMSFGLTHRIMDTFYFLPMEARSSNTNAPAVQHFNSAYEHLGNAFITTTFTRTIPSVLEILVINAMVGYENLEVGICLLGLVITYSVAAAVCSKYISDSQNQYIGSLCEGYEFIISQLDQYENAHYYGNVHVELRNLDIAMKRLSNDFKDALAFKSVASAILSMIFGVGYVATLVYTAYLFDEDVITSQQIIVLMLYILQSGISLRALSDSLGKLVSNYQTFKLLADYLDMKQPSNPSLGGRHVIAKEQANILFRNVTFNYGDDKSNLSNINLDIKPGKVTAVVGRSGSGKSTLTRLTMGFYAPNEGEILLGGRDIATCNPTNLRDNFAVVPQNAVIFSGSIMENIRYGNLDASDEEVLAAAQKAGLSDLISEDRLSEATGSSGRKLSGGQKQRISIARAYLRMNASYLILDEPTSSLDTKTEVEVLSELNKLIAERGVTVMIVTHNLQTLKQYIQVDDVIDVDKYAVQFRASQATIPSVRKHDQHMTFNGQKDKHKGKGTGSLTEILLEDPTQNRSEL